MERERLRALFSTKFRFQNFTTKDVLRNLYNNHFKGGNLGKKEEERGRGENGERKKGEGGRGGGGVIYK